MKFSLKPITYKGFRIKIYSNRSGHYGSWNLNQNTCFFTETRRTQIETIKRTKEQIDRVLERQKNKIDI